MWRIVPERSPVSTIPAEEGVVQHFMRTAQLAPELPALEQGGGAVTYGDCWRAVVAVAARVGACGPRVGLCVGRSLEGPLGFLGVLASGRSAVPLSPSAPCARLLTIAGLAQLDTVLVDVSVDATRRDALRQAGLEVVELSLGDLLDGAPAAPPAGGGAAAEGAATEGSVSWGPRAEDEAYVLFTSGSTGVPKGVCIAHSALAAYTSHVVQRSELGPGARLSNNFDLTFDPSMFDVVACLTSGATLVVPAGREAMMPVSYAAERRLTHWYSVPSVVTVARQMRTLQPGALPDLVRSSFIGEPLTLETAKGWAEAAPFSVVENVYGPTELTVSCTEYVLPDELDSWPATSNGTVPIGAVYPGLEWCLVEDGVVCVEEGELCVRGPQRLTGYLDEADNVGRFLLVEDGRAVEPPAGRPGPHLWYRTGDRVRRDGGTLLHLGRLDRQVKVRGYRLELGEVEQAVRRVEGVVDVAAVTAHGRLGDYLAVFYSGAEQPAREMRARVAQLLPPYMVPERFEHRTDLPRNDRGKTDHKALRAELVPPVPTTVPA